MNTKFLLLTWLFAGASAFGECVAVSGSNCTSPGGTNPLYTQGGNYFRNATCSQACNCFTPLAGDCWGCTNEDSTFTCYSTTNCNKVCVAIPEQSTLGRIILCITLVVFLVWSSRRRIRKKWT